MDDLLKEKINIFLEQAEKICNIKFAYIFGSYAREEQSENSDIDIAIMPDLIGIDKMAELFMRGNLIELGKPIFSKDLDVVFLNIDSAFLKYEIVHDGIVIKDNDDRISFESLAFREYFDFKYYSDYYDNAMINSIKSKKSEYMIKVKREIVLARISKLDEYIKFLDEIKKYSKSEYLNDPMIYGSTERFLHLAIECVIDIANHIIADMRYRRPDSNREIFEILFENKIIDSNLKINLCNMAGFRNILVHDYIKLDREIVYGIVKNNLKNIEDFRDIAVEYV